jgi:hypothetical protein
MNIFTIIFDSIVGFIRRNPLMITIIIMVAIFAPSLFGAALIGLLIGALLLLLIPLFVFWRLYRQARRIEREGGKAKGGFGDFHTFFDGVGGDNKGGYWNSRRGRGGFGGSDTTPRGARSFCVPIRGSYSFSFSPPFSISISFSFSFPFSLSL